METITNVIADSVKADEESINTIRFLAIDAVQKANSGHPGLPLGAAPMAYILWTKFLKHNPLNPSWFNRDRFVLSAGHGSMLLYALLHLTGYDISIDDIKHFRQWGSKTPGHPERNIHSGIETTTGPLGQGFANGVGMAMAEAYLASLYNKTGYSIIDHYTYGLVSDGDLMEGVAAEAASLAGHLKLGKLIYLYDCNHITLASATPVTFTEDYKKRFEAYQWHVEQVDDGNNLEAIEYAMRNAQRETERPSLIIIRTHIGYGSPNKQDTCAAHGSPLGAEEVKLTKENLDWPLEPDFLIPQEVLDHFRKAIENGRKYESEWVEKFSEYTTRFSKEGGELNNLMSGKLDKDWEKGITDFPADYKKGMATRVATGKVMQAVFKTMPGLIGGSADLNTSTHTELKGAGNFGSPTLVNGDMQGSAEGGWSYSGRNIQFGVREHGMASISNGMAAHGGIIPYCSTFLTFSDYMRPGIRLSALMELKVIYIFTHDSIGLGEDGPTHQPIEHLAGLRAIPGLTVIRPADANEAAMAWRMAIELKKKPVALILSRQELPVLDRNKLSSAELLRFGAYILSDSAEKPEIILIATGSEVNLIIDAGEELRKRNISVRLVSMPSWDLFEAQTKEYKELVFPANVQARIAVEAGSSIGWTRYIGTKGETIGIDTFGASAPGEVVMREYGFTVENICEKAMTLLNQIDNE